MGSHIDFVENVYDTVKHPLGYFCNKIKTLTEMNNIQLILAIMIFKTTFSIQEYYCDM